MNIYDFISVGNNEKPLGSVSDVCKEDYNKNADTFAGYYVQIIQRIN